MGVYSGRYGITDTRIRDRPVIKRRGGTLGGGDSPCFSGFYLNVGLVVSPRFLSRT